MYLKKIELQGFKSFPERTKIQLHPGITAIVGPNGTGKSNLVDALLFALGEKKPKSLRSDKKEDIIFNGNSSRPPLNMAEVTLSLAEEDDEELQVTHRFFRTGESEYRLNGKPARLKDIRDQLWKKGIGERSYFIIEQGSIAFFLNTQPTEKRLLIEEAAGTSFYKEKKRQAQIKLNNSEQNLARLEDIIEEVEKRTRSLQRQAQAARRFRRLRESIRQLTRQQFRYKIQLLEDQQHEILTHYQSSLTQEKEKTHYLKEKETQLYQRQALIWEKEQKIQSEQLQFRKDQTALQRLRSQKEKEEGRLHFLKEKIKTLNQDEKELHQETINLQGQQEKLSQEIQQNENKRQELQEQLKISSQNVEAKAKIVSAKQKAIEDIRHQHLRLLGELTETKNKLARQEKDIEFILNQEKKIRSQKENTTQALADQQRELANLGKSRQAQEEKLGELSEQLNKLNQELKKAISELEVLNRQEKELLISQQELTSKIKALEHLINQLHPLSSSSSSEGVLADWLEAQPEIARLLDNFWEIESRAPILNPEDILNKKISLPTAGVVLLVPTKSSQAQSSSSTPSKRPSLKSQLMISCPRPITLDHLPDALIVNSLEEAISSWLQHPENNYLTKSGDILFSSGLLKRGQPKEGLLTLRLAKQNLTQEQKQVIEQLKPLQEKIKKIEEKINHLKIQQDELTISLKELEKKKASLDKDISYLQKEIKRWENNLQVVNQELEILKEERNSGENQLQSLKSKEAQLSQEIDGWWQKLAEENNSLANLKQNLEQDQAQLFHYQAQEQRLKEKNTLLLQQQQQIQDHFTTLKQKLDKIDNEKKTLQEELQKGKENLTSLEKKIAQQESLVTREEKALQELENSLHLIQQQKKELEEEGRQLKQKQEKAQEERMAWEIKKAQIERDLANLEETCWQETRNTLEEIKKNVPLEKASFPEIEEALTGAKEKLQKMGNVNLVAEEEYNREKERLDFLLQQRQDLRESISSTKEAIRKIDQESKTRFLETLDQVNQYFQEIFQILFDGGQAEVKLLEPENPLESGVEIVAQPPGKRIQKLSLLSGGEKSLTSLAFLFALFKTRPAPFCLLDEVDAALDEANIGRFLNLMRQSKANTQFIIITHNFKTMEVADYLYGTTMSEPNVTTIYSLQLEQGQLNFKEK